MRQSKTYKNQKWKKASQKKIKIRNMGLFPMNHNNNFDTLIAIICENV